MQDWLFPPLPLRTPILPSIIKITWAKTEERKDFTDLSHSLLLPLLLLLQKKKPALYYEKTELKPWWLSVMFNGYMLEKLSFKIGSFFTYVMYITARVSHLHENGRLSERDKPKASSCELDVVFGIPSSAGVFLLSPRHCRISPLHHAFIFPIITQALPVLIIFSVQGVTKILL